MAGKSILYWDHFQWLSNRDATCPLCGRFMPAGTTHECSNPEPKSNEWKCGMCGHNSPNRFRKKCQNCGALKGMGSESHGS